MIAESRDSVTVTGVITPDNIRLAAAVLVTLACAWAIWVLWRPEEDAAGVGKGRRARTARAASERAPGQTETVPPIEDVSVTDVDASPFTPLRQFIGGREGVAPQGDPPADEADSDRGVQPQLLDGLFDITRLHRENDAVLSRDWFGTSSTVSPGPVAAGGDHDVPDDGLEAGVIMDDVADTCADNASAPDTATLAPPPDKRTSKAERSERKRERAAANRETRARARDDRRARKAAKKTALQAEFGDNDAQPDSAATPTQLAGVEAELTTIGDDTLEAPPTKREMRRTLKRAARGAKSESRTRDRLERRALKEQHDALKKQIQASRDEARAAAAARLGVDFATPTDPWSSVAHETAVPVTIAPLDTASLLEAIAPSAPPVVAPTQAPTTATAKAAATPTALDLSGKGPQAAVAEEHGAPREAESAASEAPVTTPEEQPRLLGRSGNATRPTNVLDELFGVAQPPSAITATDAEPGGPDSTDPVAWDAVAWDQPTPAVPALVDPWPSSTAHVPPVADPWMDAASQLGGGATDAALPPTAGAEQAYDLPEEIPPRP